MLKRKATIWAILTAAFFLGLGSLLQEEKPSGLPSVIFETMTKNVGKAD
jgi:hypothetical protein